ncbi:MAG: sulfotransferase, partial [Candidatus Levyibacteriota bacterium]
ALDGKSLAEIAAFQWHAANSTILRDLCDLGRGRWLALRYRDLLDDSAATVRRIAEFAGVPFEGPLRDRASAPLPLSRTTVSAPARDKWRRHARAIEALAPVYAPLEHELARLD